MPLPDFRINPYVQAPAPGLSEQFGKVAEQRMLDYDTNLATVDVWADQNAKLKQSVAPFVKDQAYADQIMQETKGQIDQLAESGDYENAARQIKKGATQFANRVQPLLQNQQRFSSYSTELDELRKAGKVGYDTVQKAREYSTKGYEGIDPNDPQGSMFSGFVPTEDISVADKVNKFIEGWKSDSGTGPIQLTNDGITYTRKSWEGANPKEIEYAIRQYLEGDTEYKTYRDTQGIIGNIPRVTNETENAIAAAKAKAGFSKSDTNEAWTPDSAWDRMQAKKMLVAVPPQVSIGSPNPLALNKYDVMGVETDPVTGRKVPSKFITKGEDGKYVKYLDPQGNVISREAYGKVAVANITPSALSLNPAATGGGFSAKQQGYSIVPATKEEVDEMAKTANDSANNYAAERWFRKMLADPSAAGVLREPLMEAQKSAEAKKAFLDMNKDLYTNPKFLIESDNEYREAMKNSATIQSNRTFPIALVPNSAPPQTTAIENDNNLINLGGKPVGILGLDPAFKDFQTVNGEASLNGIIDKIKTEYGDKYTYVGMRKIGPMAKNPYSNDQGAMEYAIITEDEQKYQKLIHVAVTIEDTELQILNQVTSLAAIGENAPVEFRLNNTRLGPLEGSFNVRSGAVTNANGQKVFHNYVEILGRNGRKIDDPRIPQDLSMEEFTRYYQEFLAPDLVSKHATLKNSK